MEWGTHHHHRAAGGGGGRVRKAPATAEVGGVGEVGRHARLVSPEISAGVHRRNGGAGADGHLLVVVQGGYNLVVLLHGGWDQPWR